MTVSEAFGGKGMVGYQSWGHILEALGWQEPEVAPS